MGAVSTGFFAKWASQYRDTGFNPVPIRPGSKSPAPSRWQTGRQEDDTFRLWLDQYADHGLGVLLGTPLEAVLTGGADLRDQFLIAVDVDQDDLAEPVRHTLRIHEKSMCAKRGRQGVTIFARGDQDQNKNKKLRRKLPDGRYKTLVDILANGSQTVIPPTIHPDTNAPYEWIGVSLLTARLRDLPEMTDSVMDELLAVCEGGLACEHFDALRNMVWAGEGGGGNTHDTCVSAVASMVARSWKDTQIHERIEFAKKEAAIRAGLTYDWPGSSRAIQEWIDSARKKGMDEQDDKVPQERAAAQWLIEQHGGHEQCRYIGGASLLKYSEGHWDAGSETRDLTRMVLEHFDGFVAARAESSVKTAFGLTWSSRFGHTDHSRYMVCTKEGTLNAKTLTVERHAPEHELLFQARANFSDTAGCPLYDRMMLDMLGGDQEKLSLVEEFLGWTFVQDMSFEKALFIQGPSNIGKSTLTNVLEGIHGEGAVSNVALHNIGEPQPRALLVGKLVNIGSERSRIKAISDDNFKKIVSGEPVEVKWLFRDAFSVRLFSRLINTVNEMPDMAAFSDGLARRLIIINCADAVKPTKIDTQLRYAILRERDGVFTRWMRALHRLLTRGQFSEVAAVTADIEEYVQESAGLTARWVRECCAPATSPKDYASNDALWTAYDAWTLRAGRHTDRHTSIIPWGKTMKRLGYPAVNARRGHDYIKARKLMLKSPAPTRYEGPDPHLIVAAS